MIRRVAVGGFQHESHSFVTRTTCLEDFLKPAGFPPWSGPETMIDVLKRTTTAAAGFIDRAEALDIQIAPLEWCLAMPAGPIEDAAFETIAAALCNQLARLMKDDPPDALFLDLHGAAMTPRYPDADGELLRRMRLVLGNRPLVATLDPHANVTRLMIDSVDLLVPYRTYPHIDKRECGSLAVDLMLERAAAPGGWAKVFRQIDFLIPLTAECTTTAPMQDVMGDRIRIAASLGVKELAFCFGFPYADFPDCGPSVVAFGPDPRAASAAAEELCRAVESREPQFRYTGLPVEEAVKSAIKAAAQTSKPVVIADVQDNPGGGGHGDTVGLLAEMVRQNAISAVFCLINDEESAKRCHLAGAGARVDLLLGGKSDGKPLEVSATIEKLTDGRFTMTGKVAGGNQADLGPSALITIAPGLRVVVTSRKTQPYDLSLIRHFDLDPYACKIIALKSSVHFRADFAPLADEIIIAKAPGPVIADPAELPFKNLRPQVRLTPKDSGE